MVAADAAATLTAVWAAFAIRLGEWWPAWLDDVLCTVQNFPCGTIELARDVASLLARTRRPEQTAVGLKNHGLTITGPSLEDIFDRIVGRLRTEVPMFT